MDVHGCEDLGGTAAAAAGGASGDLEARAAEACDPFGVGARGHEEEGSVPETWGGAAGDFEVREGVEEGGFEGVARGGEGYEVVVREEGDGGVPCGEHGCGGWGVFGAGAARGFLGTAAERAEAVEGGGDFEDADAFGAAEFVSADGDEVGEAWVGGEDFADPLGGVGVEESAVLAAEGEGVGPWLADAGFVGGGDEGDEGGAVGDEEVFEGVEVGGAVGVGGEGDGARAEEGGGWVGEGRVFEGGEEDGSGGGVGEPADEGVVGFGGAGCEDDFFRGAVEVVGGAFAGLLEEIACGGSLFI